MDIIDKLLQYRESSDMKLLIKADTNIDQQNLNVIVIEILSWLKLEHKRYMWAAEGKKVTQKPLKVDAQYPWCVDLQQLVREERIFNEYFKIENGYLKFSDEVTEEEKKRIRKKAYIKYNPQINF